MNVNRANESWRSRKALLASEDLKGLFSTGRAALSAAGGGGEQPRVTERNEGLLDIGVYRDQVANRLGINFGIQVFNNPATIPAIPYDVGKAGCQRRWDGGEEVYFYEFP